MAHEPYREPDLKRLRQMARDYASGGPRPDVHALTADEVDTLVHEFGVYQAELLQQNEALAHVRDDLERSRNQYATLYDLAPFGLVALSRKGDIVHCNAAFNTLSECSFVGLVQKSFADLLDKESRRTFFELLDAAAAGEPSEAADVRLWLGDDREPRILRAECRPLMHVEQEAGAFLLACMDVTARRKLETELRLAKADAEAASRAKTEFLSNMSHEIRTPMSGVQGMLGLLERSPLDEKQREFVTMAQTSAKTLQELIDDILDLSRIEAGKLEINTAPFELRKLVEDICGFFTALAAQRGIVVQCEVAEAIPRLVEGDALRIRQILYNVMGNAVKYTERGSVSLKVSPLQRTQEGTRMVQFLVTDTGMGIPREMLNDVFEPFIQSDVSYAKRIAGTGLGLTIVKRLTDLMDGRLALRSKEGEWTRVTITLPLGEAPHEETAPADADTAPSAVATRRGKPGLRLLLAEDNAINRIAAEKHLERLGHEVMAVEDGRQAIEALMQERFDAVLMDVQMPGMDGLEATRRIRNGEDGPAATPIIGLTAYALGYEHAQFIEAGMDECVAKPVDYQELEAVLRRVVEKVV